MLEKDQGVCIRTVDFSETSQVVTFFTRDNGKISVIAKGSKRPRSTFGGPIELFANGRMVFGKSHRQKLSTLTEFEQKDLFPGLRRKLSSLNGGLFAAELLDCFTTDLDPHTELYDNFVRFLRGCESAADETETLRLLIVFQIDLLQQIGSRLVLDGCSNCKCVFSSAWGQVYFSGSAGGLICRDCEASFSEKIKLSGNCVECLNNLKLISRSKQNVLDEIEKMLIYHFTELLHRPPKMAKHFVKSN